MTNALSEWCMGSRDGKYTHKKVGARKPTGISRQKEARQSTVILSLDDTFLVLSILVSDILSKRMRKARVLPKELKHQRRARQKERRKIFFL